MTGTSSAQEGLQPGQSRYIWYVTVVFFLTAVLSYTDRFILNILVDPLKLELHLTDTSVSLVQGTFFALIYGVLGIPVGRLADRTNRRNLMLAGIVLWSLATIACGFAQDFWQLVFARILVGIGESALAPCVMSMIPDYLPPNQRGKAMSAFFMGASAGSGLAFVAGGNLLELYSSEMFRGLPLIGAISPWRAVLITVGLAGAVIVGLVFAVKEPARKGEALKGTMQREAYLPYLKLNAISFGAIILAHSLVTMCDYAQTAWVPTLMMRRLHLDAAWVGNYIGVFGTIASLLGTACGGILSDVFLKRGHDDGRLRAMILFYVLVIPVLLFPLISRVAPFVIMDLICTFAISAGGIAGVTAVQDAAPSNMRGILVSIQAFMYTLIGFGVGPTAVALFTDHIYGSPDAVGLSIVSATIPAAVIAVCLAIAGLKPYRATKARFAAEATS